MTDKTLQPIPQQRIIRDHYEWLYSNNITVIQGYAPATNAEEEEVEQFYEHTQDLLELTPKKDVLSSLGTGMQK